MKIDFSGKNDLNNIEFVLIIMKSKQLNSKELKKNYFSKFIL